LTTKTEEQTTDIIANDTKEDGTLDWNIIFLFKCWNLIFV
jgi:hypothetical protein